MNDALRHRGPDGTGLFHWDSTALGHRRLAILDLSANGAQPMLSEDGRVGLVFNGAIYNFPELRRQLEAAGFRFRSQTDTEVLLHGYRHWGIEGLAHRIAGMFAFAIWDESTRELFLVRDRLGVKPLLYALRGDTIAFGSTARGLRAAGYGSELDPQAVADFLEWGVVPEQRCIYQGIVKLPPATIARWHDGQLTTRGYWQPPPLGAPGNVSFDEAMERTEALLLQAAQRRTLADVPIGVLLSGGIDSALVCWALREVGAQVSAYTFSVRGEPEDESRGAATTARELGISLTVLEGDPLSYDWNTLADAYAEPFACASALGMLRLSKAARERVTVLITGDGGDDVFLGYPHHRYLHAAQRLARLIPAGAARLGQRLGMVTPAHGLLRRPRNYAGYLLGGLGAFLRVRSSAREFQARRIWGPRLAGFEPASHTVETTPGSGRSVLTDYLEYARNHQFVSEYLAKVDGATMYFGLEARSPFLDQDLWGFAETVPYSVRLAGGRLKAILRGIARRRISERVAAGRKQGFEVPVTSWLRGKWSAKVPELLDDSELARQGWLEGRQLLEHWSSNGLPGQNLWYALVLEAWLRREGAPSIPVSH